MSSVVISGDTSGTCTLQAPAVAGSTVLTLPAQTGTVMVNGSAFSAYQSVAQSISASTRTKLTFTSVEFDTNSNYASSRFTPTVAGYYQVNSVMQMVLTVVGEGCQIFLYKNGADYKAGCQSASINNMYATSNLSAIVYCNGSTDYLEIYIFHSSGVSRNSAASSSQSFFQAAMIRSA